MKRLVALCGLFLLSGCTKYVMRDTAVYQAEINQYDFWATKQAALLREFVSAHCTCDGDEKFTSHQCAQSADFILTIESRAAWHKEMALYLAGLQENRPAENPPTIPDSSILCPVVILPPTTEEGAK